MILKRIPSLSIFIYLIMNSINLIAIYLTFENIKKKQDNTYFFGKPGSAANGFINFVMKPFWIGTVDVLCNLAVPGNEAIGWIKLVKKPLWSGSIEVLWNRGTIIFFFILIE